VNVRDDIKVFDYINLSYYVFMIMLIIYNYNTVQEPLLLITGYATIILSVLYITRIKKYNGIALVVRYFYPLVFIGFVFESLGFIVPFINPHNKDYILIGWDRAIFGNNVADILGFLNVKGVIDYLQISYLAYYFLPLYLVYYLYKRKKIKLLNYALFALSLGYYISYIGYILLPAIGPRYALESLNAHPLNGTILYQHISVLLNSLEHIKQDCFPSGHVELSLLVLLIFKDIDKKRALIILPIVLSLTLATMTLRYHYGVDVVAGTVVAFVVYYFSKYIYFKGKRIA